MPQQQANSRLGWAAEVPWLVERTMELLTGEGEPLSEQSTTSPIFAVATFHFLRQIATRFD